MGQKGFTYELKIDAEINDLIAKTNQVKKSMQSLMDSGKAPGADKIFTSIEKAIDKLQTKASQPITSVSAFENLRKDATTVGVSIDKLGSIIENLQKLSVADKIELLPPDLKKQVEDAQNALVAFSKSEAAAGQKTEELVDAEKELISAQKELKKVEGRVQDRKALVAAQSALVEETKAEANAIKAKIDALKKFQATSAAYEAAGGDKRMAGGNKAELAGLNLPADRKAAQLVAATVPGLDLKNAQSVQNAIDQLGEEYKEIEKVVADAENTQRRYSGQLKDAEVAASTASTKVENLRTKVSQLNTEFGTNKAKNVQQAYNQLRTEAGKLGVDLSKIPIDYTEENLIELNTALNQLIADGIAKVDQGVNNLQAEFGETSAAAENFGNTMRGTGEEVKKLDEAVSNTSAFAERIKQFVGLQGGIEIARSAMRNAINTIKDLDKAMTEMAVVTNLEVGDYWKQLPAHTENANKLGVAIKDVYEAETLYYQQGLKTNEVVAMSNETLKMARIAGLSAEDATNKMTAALRGFNMELNETSAQKVADVYSELAAITASDVNEISSAMTKTASIAASAGMEFETTAAFLSQIIETTRESAETAGTALKTVIARFQELKKDPSEIGEVDGEIVDANKIETALRSVGVALRDSSGQFRELDDVFLELSSKWNSLDTNTQRYIATIAAGSRQQSRFIAMMSDYSRTQELVTAANSSAGASNKQFEKTMDSLESKLNELKNAWDSFTMGIMDSDLLKAGIDLLTGILTAINNITDAFGDFSGAAKIGLLVAALYLGDKALNVFTKSIKEGSTIFQAFGSVGRSAVTGAASAVNKLKQGLSDSNRQAQKLAQSLKMSTGKKYTKNTQEYKKALEQQAEASKTAADRENAYNVAMFSGRTNTEQLNKARLASVQADQAKAAADAQLIATEQALAATLGLTTAQETEATAIKALGIGYDQAAILASAGYTAAQLTEEAASRGITAAQYAELVAKESNTKATGLAAIASFILASAHTLQQQGLKALIKSWWAQITAKFADITATWGQTGANIALQASMWPILVVTLLIVAALGILVGIVMGIIALVKWFNANSPEGKLKAAEEAADAAADAAERTAEAYNNLVEAVENLSDKYSALEEMTRGTQKWRDAVKEVNDEVLNLIEDYPELAEFVKNENGVLTLNLESKEVQDVLDEYEDKATQASNASLAAKINVNEKKAAVRAKEVNANKHLQGVYVSTGNSGYYQDLSQETLKAVSQALSSGEIYDEDGSGSMAEEISDWLVSNGSVFEQMHADAFANQLDKATKELREFGNELDTMDAQDQVMYAQMAQDAINSLDASKFTDDQLKQMNIAGTADFSKSFNEASQAELEKAIQEEGKHSETFQNAKEEVAKNLYGEDATVSGNKITYYDEEGKKQTKELTNEEFKEQWAAIDATRNMTAAFEQLPGTIDKISGMMTKSAGKAFKAMYAGEEGSAMTKADIEAVSSYTKESLQALWGNLSAEEQEAYGTFDNFWKQYSDTLKASQDALAQASETSTKAGIDVMDGISMEAARGYAEQMRHVYLLSQEGASQLDKTVRGLVSNLNGADKTNFISALNALDWQSVESIESLPETLEALGMNIPKDEMDGFISQLINSANAIRNIDVEKLKEASTTLIGLNKDIQSGNQGRSFSEEAYEALIEMSPKLAEQFQLGLDGQYTYLGSSMKDLTDAIQQNTEALLAEATRQLENQITMAKITDNMSVKQGNRELSFSELAQGHGSEETMREALEAFQSSMKANDANIIGIDNFDNKSNINELSVDEMKQIFQQLTDSAGKLEEYTKEYSQTAVEAASIIYQKNSAVENAYDVNMGQSYETSSEGQKQEFDARSAALMVQSNAAGIDSNLISQYASLVEQYKNGVETTEEGKDIYEELLVVQTELANATDYSNMRKGLQEAFEVASEMTEQYNQLAKEDFTGKINTANQALKKFGIEVTNVTDADTYMKLLEQISQGNSTALSTLVDIAQEQAGLAVNEVGHAYADGWDTLSIEQVAFFDQMEKAQLGYWKKTGDDTKQFVWATTDELQSIATTAGTAIEAWESPYTWLYNYNEEINRLTREREKAERNYARILESEGATAQELLDLTKAQLLTLQEEAALQSQRAKNAMAAIEMEFANNTDFSSYVQYDVSTGAITVDFEGLETANFTEEERAEFEEFVSSIEENRDILVDTESVLETIEDDLNEVANRGRDETSDTMNKIKDGLVMERQKEIDALQTINDSIQETQNALVAKIQEQIDDARQARENEKAEQEITDKETRLAYLMQDTSGGNAIEIAALQKEIAEQKEGYTDSLVDQQLQNLQDANAAAAEQRQQQIDIAQAQLDAYANSEAIWQQVQNILLESQRQAAASDDFASGWMNTSAYKYQAMVEGIDSLNPIEKDIKEQEIVQNGLLSSVYNGITTHLAGDVNNTTEAVSKAKDAINNITEEAGTFGKIDNQNLTDVIGKITGSNNGVTLGTVNDTVGAVNKGVTSLLGTDDTQAIFKNKDEPVIVENVKTETDSSVSEEEKQQNAIQKGISAITAFTSGGDDFRNDNDAFKQAVNEYVAAGGRADEFVRTVKMAISTGNENYDYGEHYNKNTKKIVTGTFPNTTVDGFGGDDGASYDNNKTFKFADGASVKMKQVPQNVNAANPKIADTINSLYASEGYNPQNGWVVLYQDEPYVFNNGTWRFFDDSDEKTTMREIMSKNLNPHFKTGGLADFTGPAWLDGTKSKPEIVLNQTDSANFMQLRDILADILHGTSSIPKKKEEPQGDNYYDIEINVEKIEDDYDVEQMAEKIKNMIYEDSVYRNVNLVNNIH